MEVSLVQLSTTDQLIRTFITLIPVAAVTLVGWRMGYGRAWLAGPLGLTLALAACFSVGVNQFSLGNSPLRFDHLLMGAVLALQPASWLAVSLVLVALAAMGARTKPSSSIATGAEP